MYQQKIFGFLMLKKLFKKWSWNGKLTKSPKKTTNVSFWKLQDFAAPNASSIILIIDLNSTGMLNYLKNIYHKIFLNKLLSKQTSTLFENYDLLTCMTNFSEIDSQMCETDISVKIYKHKTFAEPVLAYLVEEIKNKFSIIFFPFCPKRTPS